MKIINIMVRVYLNAEQLEESIAFYENLFGEKSRVRFKYPEGHLELAQVGACLLIAGSEAALEPFKATTATFRVDSLDDYYEILLKSGSEILDQPKQVPTGRNMLVKHPDGTLIEYVEHSAKQVNAVNIA